MELDEQVAKFHLPALSALHNVQGPVESVTERSSSLPRLAPALGMLVFRAAFADLDVKVVTVNDPFTWSTSSIRQNSRVWVLGRFVQAAEISSLPCRCRERCPHAYYYYRMRGEICSLYFLCRCGVACPSWMLLVLSRRLNDEMSNELVG